ncbi:MAG: hypothetical protein DRO06_00500 [Thermoproteota archaeon]|nr:MAG: hypothetical protein DRO06_00500 [Candidatus Korarchaeota archaeon]
MRRTALLAILALLITPVARAGGHFSFVGIEPSADVPVGGEANVTVSVTKRMPTPEGILTSRTELKNLTMMLYAPSPMRLELLEARATSPDGSEIGVDAGEWPKVELSMEDLENLTLVARLIVPINVTPGTYPLTAVIRGYEVLPNGSRRTSILDQQLQINVVPLELPVFVQVEPVNLTLPGDLLVSVTVSNTEEYWVVRPGGELEKAPIDVTNLSVWIGLGPLGGSERVVVGDLPHGSARLVKRSYLISGDIPGGVSVVRVRVSYVYGSDFSVVSREEGVVVNKFTDLSIDVVPPEDVQEGERAQLKVILTPSPWRARGVSLEVEIGNYSEEVYVGDIPPAESRTVSVELPSMPPGSYNGSVLVEWKSPYPPISQKRLVRFTLSVSPRGGISLVYLAAVVAVAAVIALAAKAALRKAEREGD